MYFSTMNSLSTLSTALGAHVQWLQGRSMAPGLYWFMQITLAALGLGALLGSLATLFGVLYIQGSWGAYSLLDWVHANDTLLSEFLTTMPEHYRLQIVYRLGQVHTLVLGAVLILAALQAACGVALLGWVFSRSRTHAVLEQSQDFATQVSRRLAQESSP